MKFFQALKLYWYGLKLKPVRMMGYSGECTWVIASSHPLYSITWTWALYWTKPKCWKFVYYDYIKGKKVFTISPLLTFGFHLSTQKAMLYDNFSTKDIKGKKRLKI